MAVSTYLSSLVQYGVNCGLIEECDRTYITNQLLQALSINSFESAAPAEIPLEEILKGLMDNAVVRGREFDIILEETKLLRLLKLQV